MEAAQVSDQPHLPATRYLITNASTIYLLQHLRNKHWWNEYWIALWYYLWDGLFKKSECRDEDTQNWGVFESDAAVTPKPALVMPTPSHPLLPWWGLWSSQDLLLFLPGSDQSGKIWTQEQTEWYSEGEMKGQCFCWIIQKQGNLLLIFPPLQSTRSTETLVWTYSTHKGKGSSLAKFIFR